VVSFLQNFNKGKKKRPMFLLHIFISVTNKLIVGNFPYSDIGRCKMTVGLQYRASGRVSATLHECGRSGIKTLTPRSASKIFRVLFVVLAMLMRGKRNACSVLVRKPKGGKAT
jgi:hypothetical protein